MKSEILNVCKSYASVAFFSVAVGIGIFVTEAF